jgi:hypothetical protein
MWATPRILGRSGAFPNRSGAAKRRMAMRFIRLIQSRSVSYATVAAGWPCFARTWKFNQ